MKLELIKNKMARTTPGGIDDFGRPIPPRAFPIPENVARGHEFSDRYVEALAHCSREQVLSTLGLSVSELAFIFNGWLWFATPEMHAEALRRLEALAEVQP